MSWAAYHAQSEHYANLAEEAILRGEFDQAVELYCLAAEQETLALGDVNPEKLRTIGITTVSATALWFKGRNLSQAQNVAFKGLATSNLPPFAQNELKELLQKVWSEEVRAKSGIEFTAGEVLVSVKGGEVVIGGAPLELILRKKDFQDSILKSFAPPVKPEFISLHLTQEEYQRLISFIYYPPPFNLPQNQKAKFSSEIITMLVKAGQRKMEVVVKC